MELQDPFNRYLHPKDKSKFTLPNELATVVAARPISA